MVNGVLRRFGRRKAVIAAVVAAASALGVAASCLAAATLLEPAPGGTVTEPHPTFRWSLPPGEKAERIEVALSPDTMPSGEFVDANILDFDDLQPDATTWQAGRELFAGPYWWMVKSRTDSGVEYTAPAAFTVRLELRVAALKLKRVRRRESIRVGWFANAEHVKVDARVYHGRRAIWSDEDAQSGSWTQTEASRFVFGARNIRRNTRLRLIVTLAALDGKVTKTVLFSAP